MTASDPGPGDAPAFRRSLGLTSAISITVGGVIGSGIFLKPLQIAHELPSVAWIFAAWIGLGVICLFGAFAYAELGAMLPEAGGQYAFLREGVGRFPAFLYGWCLIWVINSGTMAALAVAFADSLASVVHMSPAAATGVAMAMILALAVVNHFGVGLGAALQNVSTFAKLAALAAIVVGGFVVAAHPASAPAETGTRAAGAPGLLSGLVASSVAIFWAYEGWYQLPFNAAELKRPERDLPRGLVVGVLALIAIYVTVNAVYLRVVPLEEMRALGKDIEVPRLTIARIFGPAAGGALAILIALSVLGAANPNLLSTPRALYAMARDGALPRAFLWIHPTHRTPTLAIWSQAAWAIVLIVVLRTFRDITDFVIFAALLFYALTVVGLYVLRRRAPDAPRPFRCIGYPWTPALFIALVLFVDAYTLTQPENQQNALIGLGIIATGVPAYFLTTKKGTGAFSDDPRA